MAGAPAGQDAGRPETICRAVPAALEGFTAFEGRVTRLWLYEFFPARYLACFDLQ